MVRLKPGDLVRYKYEGEELGVVVTTHTGDGTITVRFLLGVPYWWDKPRLRDYPNSFTLVEDPYLPGKTDD